MAIEWSSCTGSGVCVACKTMNKSRQELCCKWAFIKAINKINYKHVILTKLKKHINVNNLFYLGKN